MAAIVGWVDRTGAGRDGGALGAMLAAVARRGAGARRTSFDNTAAIGHRGRDHDGGDGGMAADDMVSLAYDGWLDNGAQLRAELTALGRPAGSASDADCLVLAYREWGPRFVERLNGAYAGAVWDAERDELVLFRDRLGVKPLYYAPLPAGVVVFGSEPAAIFAHERVEPVVDLAGLRELVAPARERGASIWRGLAEVAPGTVLRVDRTGCHASAYWDLAATDLVDDLGVAAKALREILAEVVAEQLRPGRPAGCFLSGGLDSSALAALGARHLADTGAGPLRAYSVDFVGYVEHFQSDSIRPTPDSPYARQVAEHVGGQYRNVELSVEQLTDPAVRDAVYTASDRLPAQCDLTRTLYLLYRAVPGSDRPVMLSGEGADELLGMGPITPAVAAGPGPRFPWLAWMPGFPRFSFLRKDLVRRLDMDGHLEALYRHTLAGCPYGPQDGPYDRRTRESIYLYTLYDMAASLERADRLATLTGIDLRLPFFDHRVIERTFNVSYRVHTADGREKSLLRAAVADLLPAAVVQRRKSNLPTPQDIAYDARIRQEYQALLDRRNQPVFELADARSLDWLGTEVAGRTSALYLRRMREEVLAFNGWLAVHGARLRLADV